MILQNGIVLVVSVSIIKEDEVLIIEEKKPTALKKWNFPSGRIEYGEDILCAASREVKEETGLEIKLIGTTGVYNFISCTNNQVILFHFTGEITGGYLNLQEDEISDSRWIDVHDLLKLENQILREPKVMKQMIDNLIKDHVYPVRLFNKQLI